MRRLAFGLFVAGVVSGGVACNAILGNQSAVVGDVGGDGGGGPDSATDARSDRTREARDASASDVTDELLVDAGGDAVVTVVELPGMIPTKLASLPVGQIWAITSDSENLYWVSNASGFVYQTLISTAAVTKTMFEPSSSAPQGVAVDTTDVYWGNHGATRGVWSGPLGTVMGAGSILQPTSAGVLSVVRAADRLLWVQADYSVLSLQLGGTGFAPKSLAIGENNPQGIVAFDGRAYWANSSTGEIRVAPISGGTPARTIVTDSVGGDVVALVVDSTHVYWADPMKGLIRSAPLGGTSQTTLAGTAKGAAPCAIVADSRRIYWLNCGASVTDAGVDRGVGWADLDGNNAGGVSDVINSPIADGLPQGILVDSKNLYWIAAGQTEIHGMAKPP